MNELGRIDTRSSKFWMYDLGSLAVLINLVFLAYNMVNQYENIKSFNGFVNRQ